MLLVTRLPHSLPYLLLSCLLTCWVPKPTPDCGGSARAPFTWASPSSWFPPADLWVTPRFAFPAQTLPLCSQMLLWLSHTPTALKSAPLPNVPISKGCPRQMQAQSLLLPHFHSAHPDLSAAASKRLSLQPCLPFFLPLALFQSPPTSHPLVTWAF